MTPPDKTRQQTLALLWALTLTGAGALIYWRFIP